MKKMLSIGLMILAFFLFLSCNKKAEEASSSAVSSSKQIVLTFWGHQEEAWNDSYRQVADAFMKENPDIKIKFDFYPYDQFESKIQTSLISQTGGADIYELWGGWGIDFASTGALAPVSDRIASEIKQDSYPATYGALEYDGKLYGIPMEFNIECGAMLVNNNILREKGLSVPTTWAELVSTAQAGTEMDGDFFAVKGFDFVNWDSVPYMFTSMILSSGKEYMHEDGSFDFSSAEAKAAFEALTDLVLKYKVTDLEGLVGGSDLEGFQQLFAGKALFVPRGPWTIPEGIKTFELVYDKDFSYVSMPWYSDDIAFAAETGWSLAINGNSEHLEAACRFLDYFFQDSVLLQHNINCAQIPPKRSVAHSKELVAAMPYVEPLVSILDKSQFIGYFNTDTFKELINNTFVDYCVGKYPSVDDALMSLEIALNTSLQTE